MHGSGFENGTAPQTTVHRMAFVLPRFRLYGPGDLRTCRRRRRGNLDWHAWRAPPPGSEIGRTEWRHYRRAGLPIWGDCRTGSRKRDTACRAGFLDGGSCGSRNLATDGCLVFPAASAASSRSNEAFPSDHFHVVLRRRRFALALRFRHRLEGQLFGVEQFPVSFVRYDLRHLRNQARYRT